MAVQLLELIEQVEDDEEARMFAITAAGASFCTGFEPGVDSRLVESLAVLSKPTVAIINGDAFDEGLELAMAADIRVANQLRAPMNGRHPTAHQLGRGADSLAVALTRG